MGRTDRSAYQTVGRLTKVVLLVAVAVASPLRAQSVSDVIQPLGTMVDVGGRSLYIDCRGEGGPTVVFDGGAGTWSLHYRHLQVGLASDVRTCTYDRAGLGRSEAAPGPHTSEHMVADLRALLEQSGERGPYVLVGHSLGAYNVRLLADRLGDEVAAVVFMEAGHPEQFERLPADVNQVIEMAVPQFRGAAELAKAGALQETMIPPYADPSATAEVRAEYVRVMMGPDAFETTASLFESAPESARQSGAVKTLGATPLVVLSAGDSFAPFAALGIATGPANEVWMELQRELATMSSNSTHLTHHTATHDIHFTAPDFVSDGIRRAVAKARLVSRRNEHDAAAALSEMWDSYLRAYKAGDIPAILEHFAEDVVLMPPNQDEIQGRQAAARWLQGLFGPFEVKVELPTDEVRLVGDLAVRRGRYLLSLSAKGAEETFEDRGKFIQVYDRLSDGRWVISRGIINSDLQPLTASEDGS